MSQNRNLTYDFLKLVEAKQQLIRAKDLGLDKEEFIDLVIEINDDRLVDNISFSKGGGKIRDVHTNKLTLTKTGREYIKVIEETNL